ncbi:MAG: hypothetical protein KF744_01390 [Taibaiella sp.]|nr:hypothetical protein [Taibaiella sp.]
MNWKVIFALSLFGLGMAAATISLIPLNIEFWFWLCIFLFCAVVIAKRCTGAYFLHGFLVSLVNCIWVTGAHVLFADTYLANHKAEAMMMHNSPTGISVRAMMLIMGPVIGIISGLVLGLFAFVASKTVKG